MPYFLTHVAFDCCLIRLEGKVCFLLFFVDFILIVRCGEPFSVSMVSSRSLFSFSTNFTRLLMRSIIGVSSSSSGSSNGRFSPLLVLTGGSDGGGGGGSGGGGGDGGGGDGGGCSLVSTLSTVLALELSVDVDDTLDRMFTSALSETIDSKGILWERNGFTCDCRTHFLFDVFPMFFRIFDID